MKRLAAVLLLAVLAVACGSKDTTPRATGIPSTTTTSSTLPPLTTTTAPGGTATDDTSTSSTTPDVETDQQNDTGPTTTIGG